MGSFTEVWWLDQLKFSACLPGEIAKQVFLERLNLDAWDEVREFIATTRQSNS